MATFETTAWQSAWDKSIQKFKDLKADNTIIDRRFFQKNNMLMVEFTFENNEFVTVPMEIIEEKI
jgi:hypothetical protein